jgi:hypothetical protein
MLSAPRSGIIIASRRRSHETRDIGQKLPLPFFCIIWICYIRYMRSSFGHCMLNAAFVARAL